LLDLLADTPTFSERAGFGIAGKVRLPLASATTRKQLRPASRTPAFIPLDRHLLYRTNVTVARLRDAHQACAATHFHRESWRGEQQCQQGNNDLKKSDGSHGDPPRMAQPQLKIVSRNSIAHNPISLLH
jgi:hypothetical protein